MKIFLDKVPLEIPILQVALKLDGVAPLMTDPPLISSQIHI